MAWDWKDTIQGLITLTIGGSATFFAKKSKPTLKKFIQYTKIIDRVDLLEIEVSVLKGKQMAAVHTDPNPVFICDAHRNMIYANPAFLVMVNVHDMKDLLGLGYLKVIPDEDVEEMERLGERWEEHPSSYSDTVRYKKMETKEIVTAICRSEPIYDKNKVIVEVLGRLKIISLA